MSYRDLTTRFALTLGLVTVGCQQASTEPEPTPKLKPSTAVFSAALKDGARFEGVEPIKFEVSEGVPYATISFSGKQGPQYVTGTLYVEPDALVAATQTVTLMRVPPKAGVGYFERGLNPESSDKAISGAMSLTREGSAIRGTITAPVDALSGEFNGRYTIDCTVRPESLGRPSAGEGILVVDTKFESAFCKPFATLQPK